MLLSYICAFFLSLEYSLQTIEVNSDICNEILDSKKFSLVLFYAPWQKDCKNSIEILEYLSILFDKRDDIVIGKADIYNDRKLASKFHIEDYCVIKYFVKGSQVAESFDGILSRESLVMFVEKYSLINLSEDEFRQKFILLNEDNFDRIVKDKTKTSLVLFHANWCKKCKSLFEIMKNVGKTFQKEPQCILAHIDGEKNYKIAMQERVGVYPTFKFYSKSNKDGELYLPGKLEENWTERNITKFISVHCKSKIKEKHIVMDKMLGRIEELDALIRHFTQNTNRRENIIRETVEKLQTLTPIQRFTADFYIQIMRTILKSGDEVVDQQIEELDKSLLLKSDEESEKKRNILQHFLLHRRDEL